MEIDRQLAAAGWVVQSQDALNLSAGPGSAVREFTLDNQGTNKAEDSFRRDVRRRGDDDRWRK